MTAKSFDSQNVWGGGGGHRRYPYKLRYLPKNDQNSTYVNLFTVILLSGQP